MRHHALMGQPQPIPYSITLPQLVADLRRRHVDDATRRPSEDNLLGLLQYVARHVDDLKDRAADRHQERIDGIYLARFLELELIRCKLQLLRSGLDDGMTNRQLGTPEGLRSSAGLGDRIESYERKLAAAAHHMSVPDYVETQKRAVEPVAQPETLFNITRRLLDHLDGHDNGCTHAVDDEVLSSVENLTSTLKGATNHQANSVKTQLEWLVDELDDAARAAADEGGQDNDEHDGCPLRRARDWLTTESS